MPTAQFVVWRLIHDATHLLHLATFPEAGDPLDPQWLIAMEAFAMSVETGLALRLMNGDELAVTPGLECSSEALLTVLLLGLVERSLRLEFDVAVHGRGEDPEAWTTGASRRSGLRRERFSFVDEFHGLPGFGAAYMAGVEVLDQASDALAVAAGSEPLDWTRLGRASPLSTDPRTDVPTMCPQHELEIQHVGVSGTRVWVHWTDPIAQRSRETLAEARADVDLRSTQRGIHMSRLQQILTTTGAERVWTSLPEAAREMAMRCRAAQNSRTAEVELRLTHIVEDMNALSRTRTTFPITLGGRCRVDGALTELGIEIELPILTACPCTAAFSKLSLDAVLERSGISNPTRAHVLGAAPPTCTHSQPGTVRFEVSSTESPPPVKALLETIRGVVHVRVSVLKREDEHALVERVHHRPQFCEDVCRGVAAAVAEVVGPGATVRVEVALDESIHAHRASARLQITTGDSQ
jgi:GTP cyclohydrolase FolE2